MKQLRGIAVAPWGAIAEALGLSCEGFRSRRNLMQHDALDHEMHRLDAALDAATNELASYRDEVTAELGQQCGGIFAAHLQMLRDPHLREEISALVKERNSPEYAVS